MKPFLKWAGGKTKLLKGIEQRLPVGFNEWKDVTYVEPFVGGGAVLFHMLSKHQNIKHAIINDINQMLMKAYSFIQQNPDAIVDGFRSLVSEFNKLSCDSSREDFYYRTRKLYNSLPIPDEQRILFFLFLNKTCFNGLYRENQDGNFNVPFGRYQSISFDEKNIFEVHKALQSVLILCGDFDNVFSFIKEGNNFIYIDPPYRPVGKNMNMFTQYDRSGFKDNDQQRLKDLCNIFGQKGCKIMISNSDSYIEDETSYFEQLYEGYLIDRIQVTRTINTYNAKELRPKEVIITNYETPIIHQPKLF